MKAIQPHNQSIVSALDRCPSLSSKISKVRNKKEKKNKAEFHLCDTREKSSVSNTGKNCKVAVGHWQ